MCQGLSPPATCTLPVIHHPPTRSPAAAHPLCPPAPAETQLLQRDAAELVADRKPEYLQLKAGDQGAHFLLIEVRGKGCEPWLVLLGSWRLGGLALTGESPVGEQSLRC